MQRLSLRAPGIRLPAARIALQTGLIGDANGPVTDVQTVTPAIRSVPLERDFRGLDQAGAEQHAITRHANDVALEPAEIRQKNFRRLLLALRPTFGDPLVPIRRLLAGARQRRIGRAPRIGPDARQIA